MLLAIKVENYIEEVLYHLTSSVGIESAYFA